MISGEKNLGRTLWFLFTIGIGRVRMMSLDECDLRYTLASWYTQTICTHTTQMLTLIRTRTHMHTLWNKRTHINTHRKKGCRSRSAHKHTHTCICTHSHTHKKTLSDVCIYIYVRLYVRIYVCMYAVDNSYAGASLSLHRISLSQINFDCSFSFHQYLGVEIGVLSCIFLYFCGC